MRSFLKYCKFSDFPIENLPYGIFTAPGKLKPRIGVAIADSILDLNEISQLFDGPELKKHQHVFKESTLNRFMGLTPKAWKEARSTIQNILSEDNPVLQNDDILRKKAFTRQSEAKMHLPAQIGDFTDFSSSIHHAKNAGNLFRGKENAIATNWKHLPVAYHCRASTVVISGTPIHRPYGQAVLEDGGLPVFGPSKLMDYELEMAFFVGGTNNLGEPIKVENAQDHIFGFVIMNDWSARDILSWEYVPLGPFVSKNFSTTISPWVVTTFALEPFKTDNYPQEPEPLSYLRHSDNFNYDIHLQVDVSPKGDTMSRTVCRSNFKNLYWTPKQQLAHHTITGCKMNPGDLLGSGTISGESPESFGSTLELAWKGTKPRNLLDGSQNKFLQDGDTVTMTAVCKGDTYNIGFGTCVGTLLPPKNIY
ncbi:fumarylacetoacetase-like [Diorhabda carinulata]|uniref:fumarylacetoacetase-like n=1 Tax=Diorhabda carinulata TaxID=1163345 RepID=UPI0025A2FBE4|nr:fumarylacetoacetase-like [Diorhabda carinulata]